MHTYCGDVVPGTVLDVFFSTKDTDNVPTTLGGSPSLAVYGGNSVVQSTAGVTLDVDFDGVTGMNHVRVDTSADAAFYAAGKDFTVVVAAGTVGGVSVVGRPVASFSVGRVWTRERLDKLDGLPPIN